MAKRRSAEEKALKRLLKMLPASVIILIICVGICFGALVETGVIKLSDVQNALGFTVFDKPSQSSGGNIPDSAKDFGVFVIDVGQGDSILITTPTKSVLIDAGEKESAAAVTEFIRSKGIIRLDYIIATHPHSDHIGGMADVINEFGADKIIVPKLTDNMVPTTKTYENFLNAVKNKGCKLTAAKEGTVYDLGTANGKSVKMTILAPVKGAEYDDLNDYSVCARIDMGKISWLLTGDLSKDGEKDLINSDQDIDVTAYKVGHHGSATSSSAAFLKEVTPKLCVISCGEGNSYGHPADSTMKRLEQYTSSIYRTDLSSTVSVYSDGEKLYVSKGK